MVGVSKKDCILTITMQSLTFIVPSLIISYLVAVVANHFVLAIVYTPDMGVSPTPIPDTFSTI